MYIMLTNGYENHSLGTKTEQPATVSHYHGNINKLYICVIVAKERKHIRKWLRKVLMAEVFGLAGFFGKFAAYMSVSGKTDSHLDLRSRPHYVTCGTAPRTIISYTC